MQGAILTKLKDYDGARVFYEKALKQEPGFFPARYNIGALMAFRGDWEPAITHFRNMIIDQPNNELVQYKLLLLLLTHDSDPALQGKLFTSDTPPIPPDGITHPQPGPTSGATAGRRPNSPRLPEASMATRPLSLRKNSRRAASHA